MRSNLRMPLYLLLAGALLSAGCRARKSEEAPARAQQPAAAAKDDWQHDAIGCGRTREEAEQEALASAAKQVKEHLRQQRPPVLWPPTAEFVREHLQSGPAQRRKDLEKDLPIEMQCWSVSVELTPEGRAEIARLDAQYRVEEQERERAAVSRGRMLLLGRVLVALVAGLLALFAYLRLDEWTKGYYSRWLAAGAAGSLAAVGLGLWLCC